MSGFIFYIHVQLRNNSHFFAEDRNHNDMKYLITILLLTTGILPQKSTIGLKLEIGKTYSQTYISKVDMTQDLNGIKQQVKMDITGGMDFKVTGKSSDQYEMDVAYTSLVMKMDMGGMEMVMSSESADDDVFSVIMKNMIGKTFNISMKRNGTISDIRNLDNVFSSVFTAFPDLPEMQKQQILTQVKQAYGEKAFKGNIEMITAIFPDKSVSIGDTWTNSIQLESGMAGLMNNTFTLVDKETISAKSTMSTEDKEAYVDVNGMPTKYNLNGTMNSTFTIDPTSNWIVKGVINQNISGDISIKDNPGLPGGMTIPIDMVSTMSIGQ